MRVFFINPAYFSPAILVFPEIEIFITDYPTKYLVFHVHSSHIFIASQMIPDHPITQSPITRSLDHPIARSIDQQNKKGHPHRWPLKKFVAVLFNLGNHFDSRIGRRHNSQQVLSIRRISCIPAHCMFACFHVFIQQDFDFFS